MGTENRGLRVYDSYGNNIGIRSVASNGFEYADLGPCGLLVPLKSLRAGVKYQRLWDFNYTYEHQFLDDFYQITRIEQDNHSGQVDGLAPLAAFHYRSLNLGVEGDFLFGRKQEQHRVMTPGVSDTITGSESRFSGKRVKIGLLIMTSLHFRLGYCYAGQCEMEGEDSSALVYPAAHTLGFFYQPAGRVPTRFMAEVVREEHDVPLHIYKFGIEHTIVHRFALRYGFCVFPDPAEPAIWTTVLTLGFGLNAAQYHFDLGYGHARRNYANTDFGGLDIDGRYFFDESIGHIVLSGGVQF
jgi:hypothetical protein